MKKRLQYFVKVWHLFIIVCTTLYAIFDYHVADADTIKLKDGSMLVGKLIKEEKRKVIFSNSFGTFTIKRPDITQLFITESYTEDIKINKQLGKMINKKSILEIQKNYTAGEKNKKKLKVTEHKDKETNSPIDQKWVNGRLSFSGSFMWILGEINPVLPYGFNGYFAIDQGLDMIIKKRHAMMPGIRFEYGYSWAKMGKAQMTGHNGSIGLIWALPSMKNSWGNFVLILLPGMSFLYIEKVNNNYKLTSNTFTAQAVFGYQYSYKAITVFIHARYLYIYDKDVLYQSVGGEFGIGFNCW